MFLPHVLPLVLATLAAAHPWDGPAATPTADRVKDTAPTCARGSGPIITGRPILAENDLRKRAFGVDATCGYTLGNINSVDTCQPGATCALASSLLAVGCCVDPNNCQYITGCVDYASRTCTTSGCTSQPGRLTCSLSSLGVCGGWAYVLDASRTASFRQCFASAFQQTVFTTATNSASTTSTSSSSSSSSSSTTSTSSSSSPSPTASKGGSSNAGAIAGGVVGGIAVIALVIVGVLLLMRYRKKHAPPAAAAASGQTPMDNAYDKNNGQYAQAGYGQQQYQPYQQGYDQGAYNQPQGFGQTPPQGYVAAATPQHYAGTSPTSPGGNTTYSPAPAHTPDAYQAAHGTPPAGNPHYSYASHNPADVQELPTTH